MAKRKIDPTELKCEELMEFALVALVKRQGSASLKEIHDTARVMLKNKLTPADRRLMCSTPAGEDFAPPGYTGKTWEVWEGKMHTGIGAYAKWHNYTTVHKGVYTLTQEGWDHMAGLAYNWLAQ